MASVCPSCGYENAPGDPACGLCGEVLHRVQALDDPFRLPTEPTPEEPRGVRVPVGWVHLGVGLGIAILFTLTPMLRFMGWLLGSLFHETGHVVFAWFVGCPAFPAISLAGHAAAYHQPQSMAVALLVGAVLIASNVLAFKTGRFRGLAASLLVAWPLFTFFELPRELGFLLSGHLGELTFAGIFLWRARTGEAIQKEAERPIYAGLGWFLVARNVTLGFGLAFVPAVRAWYMGNGSFGLMNDYARIAYQVLHVPLESVGAVMGLISLGVFPIVLAMTWTPPAPAVPPRPRTSLADRHRMHQRERERLRV